MPKFKRRPAVVDAVQWGPNKPVEGVKETAPERGDITPRGILRTQYGTFIVKDGDWIVTGPGGHKWVVEFGVFQTLYEPATPITKELDALEAEADYRTCPKCGGHMAHYRLKGYRCPRCD